MSIHSQDIEEKGINEDGKIRFSFRLTSKAGDEFELSDQEI